jgi:hypothetical protein
MSEDSPCVRHICSPYVQSYPLVNCPITMENHHFSWDNSLFLWAIFNGYSSHIFDLRTCVYAMSRGCSNCTALIPISTRKMVQTPISLRYITNGEKTWEKTAGTITWFTDLARKLVQIHRNSLPHSGDIYIKYPLVI